MLLVLGHGVRTLTWEGGLDGRVTGAHAKKVLTRCLVAQVQLLQDWECRTEYTRTLSVALLQWQPWHSSLPGCCFVEESCEAMLSRAVGRCRANTQLTDLDDIFRLFITMPLPSREPRGTVGGVPQSLLVLFTARLRRIIHHAASQPFARCTSAQQAVWDAAFPTAPPFPRPLTTCDHLPEFTTVLSGAITNLWGGSAVTEEVRAFQNANIPVAVDDLQTAVVSDRIRQWTSGRRRRMQEQRQSTRQASQSSPQEGDVHAGARTAEGDQPQAGQPPDDHHDELDSAGLPVYDVANQFSEGFHSYGDSDGLGTVGDLVATNDPEWEGLYTDQ